MLGMAFPKTAPVVKRGSWVGMLFSRKMLILLIVKLMNELYRAGEFATGAQLGFRGV